VNSWSVRLFDVIGLSPIMQIWENVELFGGIMNLKPELNGYGIYLHSLIAVKG